MEDNNTWCISFCGSSTDPNHTCKVCRIWEEVSPNVGKMLEIMLYLRTHEKQKRKLRHTKLEKVAIYEIEPFTVETIEQHAHEFTLNTLIGGVHQLTEFILSFVKKENNKSYICTDKVRNSFSRFIGDGKWERDPKGLFVEQVFIGIQPVVKQLLETNPDQSKTTQTFASKIMDCQYHQKLRKKVICKIKTELTV